MASFKIEHQTVTVAKAVADAFGEVENLASEMREWADNMDGGGLGHTSKFEAVEEAASALEDIEDPGTLPSLFDERETSVTVTVNTRKGRPLSRATRAADAAGQFRTAAEDVRTLISELEEIADNLESAADALEGIEFPTAFGG